MRQLFVIVLVGICVCSCARRQPAYYSYNPANDYYVRLAAPPAPTPTPLNEIAERTKPEMSAWVNCVFDKTAKYMQLNEQAEVTVRAAMTACYPQENSLRSAISLINGSGYSTNDLMVARHKIIFEELTKTVIEQRVNLVAAKRYVDSWTDCLVNAAIVATTAERSESQIVAATYALCQDREDAMRRQLASFNRNSETIIEDRKRRVLPILVKFVHAMKNLGKGVKKPDLSA